MHGIGLKKKKKKKRNLILFWHEKKCLQLSFGFLQKKTMEMVQKGSKTSKNLTLGSIKGCQYIKKISLHALQVRERNKDL